MSSLGVAIALVNCDNDTTFLGKFLAIGNKPALLR